MYQVTAVNKKGFQVYSAYIEANSEKEAKESAELYVLGEYETMRAVYKSEM